MKRFMLFIPLLLVTVCLPFLNAAPISVTYTVNTGGSSTPISKYVYGSNWGGGTDYTIRRSGGNRLTAYNWENNWSNAGADWWWSNDQYMSSSSIPGKAITDFHNSALSQNQASIVTLQMAGYVSDAVSGLVDCNLYAAPSMYFKKVVSAKGAAFCNPPGSPNTTDANVYMDEFVNFLVNTYGYAGTTNGVKFYNLDNEPALWYQNSPPYNATHWEVHPFRPTCVELRDKSIALSTAVKNVDPNAQILGPVLFGFSAYLNFSGASDWGSQGAGYNWFISYYLDKFEAASASAGKRLLDTLDVHWYPEATDGAGHRILDNSITTTAMYNARMQAPRSLWDPDYSESSWIHTYYHSWLPILPPLQNSINTYYPDTNLAITEYDYGGQDHYTGGIATSDVLGIFGKYGVYIATYWGDGSYVKAAFKLYTNYNGWNSFGDTNVPATTTNKTDSSIYASIFTGDANELHLIVLNKNINNAIIGTFNITSTKNYTIGRVWAFDGNSPDVKPLDGTITVTSNSFTYIVSPKTANHIILWESCPYLNEITGDCRVDMTDFNLLINQWLDTGDCSADPDCADLNGDNIVDFLDFALLVEDWLK